MRKTGAGSRNDALREDEQCTYLALNSSLTQNWTAKMLMKSPTSTTTTRRVLQSLDANIARLLVGIKQLYGAIKHRRDIAALAEQDDHLLADIGLTRNDVRSAIAQPFWCDPTES